MSSCDQPLTFVNTSSSSLYEKQLVKLNSQCYLQMQFIACQTVFTLMASWTAVCSGHFGSLNFLQKGHILCE